MSDPNEPDNRQELAAALIKARIEIVNLRQDAERFRWLLTQDHPEIYWWQQGLTPDQIRAGIDEEMRRVIDRGEKNA